MRKAYVLLSGGVDSSTCLHLAYDEFDKQVVGVSINYGQRHLKEAEYARAQCEELAVPHRMVDLRGVVGRFMLTDKHAAIPDISYAEIEGVSPTYVPFRNGLLLSAITSIVHGEWVKIEASQGAIPGKHEWGIYFGAHAEDAHNWAYPDCTNEFTGAMANAIYIGSYRAIRLHVPLQWMVKDQIIKLGTELGVNWSLTWSCYGGGDVHCGTCPTCRARKDGFVKAGVKDPTEYAK